MENIQQRKRHPQPKAFEIWHIVVVFFEEKKTTVFLHLYLRFRHV